MFENIIGNRAARLDGVDVSRFEFVDGFVFGIENGHQGDAFGGEGDELVSNEVVARADAVWIADDKCVAVANHANHGVAAVPVFARFADDFGGVELKANGFGDGFAGETLITHLVVNCIVSFIEFEADFFEDSLGVGSEDGVLTAGDEAGVELIEVGHVKIACQHKIACRPVTTADVGVEAVFRITAGGAVAEVSEEDFATEVEVVFYGARDFGEEITFGDKGVVIVELAGEYAVEWITTQFAVAEHERFAGGHVEFDATDAGAILSAVVLFFHEEKQFVKSPERCAVFLLEVIERFEQTH